MRKKKGKIGLMFIKIEIKKTYDIVDSDILEQVLSSFSFHLRWIC